MATRTQEAGQASETQALAQVNGFLGWSPEGDRTPYSVLNGADGTPATAYATLTAYAVGKTVTYNGVNYVVRTAVTSANATAPDTNPSFVQQDRHRGTASVNDSVTERSQFYR